MNMWSDTIPKWSLSKQAAQLEELEGAIKYLRYLKSYDVTMRKRLNKVQDNIERRNTVVKEYQTKLDKEIRALNMRLENMPTAEDIMTHAPNAYKDIPILESSAISRNVRRYLQEHSPIDPEAYAKHLEELFDRTRAASPDNFCWDV